MSGKDAEVKKGDKFNAYLLDEHIGKLAIGCPCIATKITTHCVWTKERKFDRTKFSFITDMKEINA